MEKQLKWLFFPLESDPNLDVSLRLGDPRSCKVKRRSLWFVIAVCLLLKLYTCSLCGTSTLLYTDGA